MSSGSTSIHELAKELIQIEALSEEEAVATRQLLNDLVVASHATTTEMKEDEALTVEIEHAPFIICHV